MLKNLNKSSLKKLRRIATIGVASLALVVPLAMSGVSQANTNVHADSLEKEMKNNEESNPQNAGIAEDNSHFHMNEHPYTMKQASKYGDEWSPSKKDMEEMNKEVGHNIFRGKYWRDYIRNGYKHVNSHARRHHNSYRGHKHAKRVMKRGNNHKHLQRTKYLSYYAQGKKLGKYIHNRKDDNYGGVQYLLNNHKFSNKNFRKGYYKGYVTALRGDDENPKPRAKAAFKIASSYQASHNKMFKRGIIDGIKADYYGKPNRRYAHNKEYKLGFKLFSQIE